MLERGGDMSAEQLWNVSFPSGLDWDLATISCRAPELARRLGVELERWEEDGLGWASGFALGPPETPTLIRELEEGPNSHPLYGTVIVIDGGEAASVGHRASLDRVLAALGLDDGAVSWIPDDLAEWALAARQLIAFRVARRERANPPMPGAQ